ncbi:MAG: radical SAM protein [Acetobacteraceae bacterium]|nr:radical SAM protein [Acetobacteraceae bacterium]
MKAAVDFDPSTPLLLSSRAMLLRTNLGALVRAPRTGRYRMLSQAQALGLALCDGTHSLAEIVPALADLYRLPPEAVEAEMARLYSECLSLGVLAALPVRLPGPSHDFQPFVFRPEEAPAAVHPRELQTLGLELTQVCTLSCAYCFASDRAGRPVAMPTDMALRLLEEGRRAGARSLILGGGEPLAHPDVVAVIGLAVRLGYRDIQVSTKATVITRGLASDLRRAGLDQIQVSLDSWYPEEWEGLVGRQGAWARALEGLVFLLQEGFTVIVRPTITRINADRFPDLVLNLARLGIRSFRAATVVPVGRAGRGLLPSAEQVQRLEAELNRVRQEAAVRVELAAPRAGAVHHCPGGRLSLYVLAGGRVVPCDFIATLAGDAEVLGDARGQSLAEIWGGERVRAFRRPRVTHPACRACEMLLFCAGGCRVRAFTFSGDMNQPDPRCPRVHPEFAPGALVPA